MHRNDFQDSGEEGPRFIGSDVSDMNVGKK